MAIPHPTDCCFYRIQEGTKEEYVSIGSNGNILRWADTGETEQHWLIIPVSDSKCRIMTRSNGEFMAVGSNGNIVRWKFEDEPAQEFSFVNESKGWWNIQEGTKQEFVSVGSNGNILRWAKSNKNDQRFRLIPVASPRKPDVQKGMYDPDTIPGHPRITATNPDLPYASPRYLIGEMVVPAVLVDDSGSFSDRISQVEQNPYYVLTRERFWDRSSRRGYLMETTGLQETRVVTVTQGVTEKESSSMERVTGMKVTVSGGFNLKGTKKGAGEGGATASISQELTNQLKIAISSETTRMTEKSEQKTITFPAGQRLKLVAWSLVDRYTLKSTNGRIVSQWEVVDVSTLIEDSFPIP